jgi:hypothetical protein
MMDENSRFANTEGAVGEPYLVVHTVTQAEDDAGSLTIWTPFNIITGYPYTMFTSAGVKDVADKFSVTTSGGVITVADSGDSVTVNDVIHMTVWGKGGR